MNAISTQILHPLCVVFAFIKLNQCCSRLGFCTWLRYLYIVAIATAVQKRFPKILQLLCYCWIPSWHSLLLEFCVHRDRGRSIISGGELIFLYLCSQSVKLNRFQKKLITYRTRIYKYYTPPPPPILTIFRITFSRLFSHQVFKSVSTVYYPTIATNPRNSMAGAYSKSQRNRWK